jgi:hypothetical protein
MWRNRLFSKKNYQVETGWARKNAAQRSGFDDRYCEK